MPRGPVSVSEEVILPVGGLSTEKVRLPPDGRSGITKPCEHEFRHMKTSKWYDNAGGYNTEYNLVETFYCTRCMKIEEIKKTEHCREVPDWFR